MCGLCAAITLKRPEAQRGQSSNDDASRQKLHDDLLKGLDLIKHRGPDAQDVWINPENTVGKDTPNQDYIHISPQRKNSDR